MQTDGRVRFEVRIGCAGWSLPRGYAQAFPGQDSHLERYARRLPAVEIDSSFYHPHRRETYARWAASTPDSFRFAVKVPKEITHVQRLNEASSLDPFLAATSALGEKLGPLLLQLPPGLAFQPVRVERFLDLLRARFSGLVACEPRHPSWFSPQAEGLMAAFSVARVAADPAIHPLGTRPGSWQGLAYYRLHGSPQMHSSAYTDEFLQSFARLLLEAAGSSPVWCIFNNTAAGAALGNALTALENLGPWSLA